MRDRGCQPGRRCRQPPTPNTGADSVKVSSRMVGKTVKLPAQDVEAAAAATAAGKAVRDR